MTAENLLSKLEKVKPSGSGRWVARCPAHDDKGPSLSIRELDSGRVLVHCFAGCDVQDVLAAAGLTFDDLYPPRTDKECHGPERRPFPAVDILRCVAVEMRYAYLVARTVAEGQPVSPLDLNRLMLACSRLSAAIDAGGLNND